MNAEPPTARFQNGASTAAARLCQTFCGQIQPPHQMEEQQPRGVLPDAMDGTTTYLIKKCTYLRLTYEIRLMAFMAQQNGRTFVLVIPERCQFAPSLNRFINDGHVHIRRV